MLVREVTFSERELRAAELYKAGVKTEAIRTETGINESDLYVAISALGIPLRYPGRKRKPAQKILDAIRAYRLGEGPTSINRRLGVRNQVLYRHLKANRVSVRQRVERSPAMRAEHCLYRGCEKALTRKQTKYCGLAHRDAALREARRASKAST